MRYRLRQLELDDKMCQQVSLQVFEQVYPPEIVCEQLSLHHAWEERERVLNMFVLIQLLLAAALWTRLAFPRVLERAYPRRDVPQAGRRPVVRDVVPALHELAGARAQPEDEPPAG